MVTSVCLCLSQDIVTRHLAEKSAAEDRLPPLGPVVWAAGSHSELTPSESLATSDAVRDASSPPSMRFMFPLFSYFLFKLKPVLQSIVTLTLLVLLSIHSTVTSLISLSLRLVTFHLSLPRLMSSVHVSLFQFSDLNFPSPHFHCLWIQLDSEASDASL